MGTLLLPNPAMGIPVNPSREISEEISVREEPWGFYSQVASFLTLHEVGKNSSGIDMSGILRRRKDGGQCRGSGEGTCAWGPSLTSCNSESWVAQLSPLFAMPFLPLGLGNDPIFGNGELVPPSKLQ